MTARRHAVAGLALALVAALFVPLAGCDQMADQPKDKAGTRRDAATVPAETPPGVVARGAEDVAAPPVTAALLARGRARFDIACSPCHGRIGDGHGRIVARGFPQPPSFHSERLRAAPVEHVVDVITHGYGAMYSYAARVSPADRWAIAAYIRALQVSQNTAVAELSTTEREHLP